MNGVSIIPCLYLLTLNETTAQYYFSLTKDDAIKLGAKWQDNDYSLIYDGSFYEPKDNISEYKNDECEQQKLLNGVTRCEVSGKPFKVMPQELAFYIEHGLPIPRKHFNVRFKERFDMRNPRKLYHRKCMNEDCSNEFETTYAPDRREKVYCEDCYQKEILG